MATTWSMRASRVPSAGTSTNRWRTRRHLARARRRVERLDVVEDAEDRPQRHPGALGHLLGGGPDHALVEQVEQGVDGEVAAAVPPGAAPVDGGVGDGRHALTIAAKKSVPDAVGSASLLRCGRDRHRGGRRWRTHRRVELRDGAVTGTEGDGVRIFRGIPYATAERFAPPVPAGVDRRPRRHRLRSHRAAGAGRPVPAGRPRAGRAVPVAQRVDTRRRRPAAAR